MTALRAAADRLWRGSALLGQQRVAGLADWVRASGGPAGLAGRLLLVLGAGLLVWRAARLWPALLWLAVPAWCVAAWRAVPPVPDEPLGEDIDGPPATPPGDAIRALLWQLIGDAPGVHLNTVLAHLQEHGHHPTWKVADLRQHLERHGIPVDLKLKLAGTPTRGVRRDALGTPPPAAAQAPSPAASPAV
ncbi:hypothetical protein [Streptomyces sp. NPDC058674]|uniref:hypothetical protein n=1 Tax=Streptomyces sp. NPDC058674 TaxID=3346592 RepID=UPI00366744A4